MKELSSSYGRVFIGPKEDCFRTAVFLAEGQSANDLLVRDETVILLCEDRTVTLSAADFVGDADPDATKNSLTARFEGSKCVEVF